MRYQKERLGVYKKQFQVFEIIDTHQQRKICSCFTEESAQIILDALNDSFMLKIKEFCAFASETFRRATPTSSITKLETEISELKKELSYGQLTEFLIEEYVDCIMCLLNSYAACGLTADSLFVAFCDKLEKNKLRKWKLNSDNTYSHIK